MQRTGFAVPEVAEKVRLDVPFGEEFLIAAETWFAGGKELLVHLAVIEAGHGPQSRPSARAAMIKYAPCKLEFRFAVASDSSAFPSNSLATPGLCGNSFGSCS